MLFLRLKVVRKSRTTFGAAYYTKSFVFLVGFFHKDSYYVALEDGVTTSKKRSIKKTSASVKKQRHRTLATEKHYIPNYPTKLSNRKNKSSIRAVPLVGTSLYAAQRLFEYAKGEGSEWLAPEYAHYHGSNSCSAILNKHLKDLDFRSHMFRHALIDRMKACNDIPTRLAESITGHCSGGSEFNNYGTVGYTLEQKLEVLKRISI